MTCPTHSSPQQIPSTEPQRGLGRLGRALGFAGALGIALVFGGSFASAAFAHDELVAAEVVSDAADGTPEGFLLQFNNEVIPVGTEIIATDESGADVLDGDPVVDGRTVTQALLLDAPPQVVDIAWRVVSSDGHPISGALVLEVDATGEAVLAPSQANADSADATPDTGSESSEATNASSGLTPSLVIGGALLAGAVLVIAALVIFSARRRSSGTGTR